MKRVMRIQGHGKVKDVGLQGLATMPALEDLDAKIALIQTLIPLGLQAVAETLQKEVTALTGEWSQRSGGRPGAVRWSSPRGSVSLLDQKLPITYQRVRDRLRRTEIPLAHLPAVASSHGPRIPGSFGRSCTACPVAGMRPAQRRCPRRSASVPRPSPGGSSERVRSICRPFRERKLDGYDVIALGMTVTGEKVLLGFVQTATENERVCAALLRELIERGLQIERGLLCVIDGAKGLRTAITDGLRVPGPRAAVSMAYAREQCGVPPEEPARALAPDAPGGYEQPTSVLAKAALLRRRTELRLLNESAVTSLDEGLEETLTLHRLGLFGSLGISLKTTHGIESLNAQLGAYTDTVDRWRTSEQKHRWVASALLTIEPRLHRIKGYRHLPLLREALQREIASNAPRCESVA